MSAFYISGDGQLYNNRVRIMPFVLAAGKPTVGAYTEWARAGLLMSYSSDVMDLVRNAGIYAAKIVNGAKPGDLPIEQASKFTFVINLKTAKALGISIPQSLAVRADEVIQ